MKKNLRKLVSLCLAAALVFTAVKLSNITVNAADAVSSVTKIWEGSETAEWSKRIPLEIDWGKANAGDVLLLSAVTEGNSEAYSSFHLINPSWENIISDLSFGYTEGATKTATIMLTNALITACKDGAGVQGFGFTLKKAELVSSKAVKNKTTFNDTAAWGKRIDLGINWNNVSAGDMLILTAVTEGNAENYSSLKLINSSWETVVDNLSFGYKDGATRYCTIVLTSNIINSAKENGGLGAQGIGFTLKQVSVYSKTLAATATSTPVPTATSTPVPTATSTPVPTATSTPVPTATSTPVPTEEVTPAPVEETTPAPVEEVTPAPVEETTPAPVEETTPAPVEETTPAPVEETTPAPVEETTPAPVEEVTPAPVEEATPTPEVENIEDNKTPLDAPDATNGAKNDTDVPKTGDAGSLFEVLLFIGVCGLTVTKLVKKH